MIWRRCVGKGHWANQCPTAPPNPEDQADKNDSASAGGGVTPANARPSNTPPNTFKAFPNSSVVKSSDSAHASSDREAKVKELHRQVHAMMAAQIEEESVSGVILENDLTQEMISNKSPSPELNTAHSQYHVVNSISVSSPSSESNSTHLLHLYSYTFF